jgi:ComF family protein
MIETLKYVLESTLRLFYPHLCAGCNTDALDRHRPLCIQCDSQLPLTGFESHSSNPVEKLFWGRLPVVSACSTYHFSKGTLMQTLLHAIKYGGHQQLARHLGTEMGKVLTHSGLLVSVDGIVPVPLHSAREKQRGYNQSALLAAGIEQITGIKSLPFALCRNAATDTQTKKSRLQRWQNVQYKFECRRKEMIQGKQLLLIDDVITTGATLDACGQCLLDAGAASIRIATLAYAGL